MFFGIWANDVSLGRVEMLFIYVVFLISISQVIETLFSSASMKVLADTHVYIFGILVNVYHS